MSAVSLHLVDPSSTEPTAEKSRAKRVARKNTSKGKTTTSKTTRPSPQSSHDKTDAPTSAAQASTKAQPKRAKKTAPSRSATKRHTQARDLMQSPVACCRPEDSLNTAAQLMWENDLGALVVTNDAGQPVGMITDRDACMAAYTQGVALFFGSVDSAMARHLVACHEDAPISRVVELMAQAQVRRVPVVDEEGKLVGIVGWSDIVKESVANLPKDRKRGSSEKTVVKLFGAIFDTASGSSIGQAERAVLDSPAR